jgi:hypothetical protein
MRLGQVEQISRWQHDPTAPLAAALQVPTPYEVSVKQHLHRPLMHPDHCPSATQGRTTCSTKSTPYDKGEAGVQLWWLDSLQWQLSQQLVHMWL